MSNPQIIIIVAMAQNRVIGNHNRIPWHIPEDLAHFKATTMGHGLIMGRKTWESIGRPLPGRTNIVITRTPNFRAKGCGVCASIEEGIRLASQTHNIIFIIGGGEIYNKAITLATTILISKLHREVKGDVLFPPIDPEQFQLKEEKTIHASEPLTLQRFIRTNQPGHR